MEKKYLSIDEAVEIIRQQGFDQAIIHNPDNVFPPIEIFPLAEKITSPANKIVAAVLEMEGTILSTRNINLYALETMVRQISARAAKEEWHGLDKIIDHRNIIGIPVYKQVEFLMNRYNNFIKSESLKEAFFFSALAILISTDDEYLKAEVKDIISKCGCNKIFGDEKLIEFSLKKKFDKYNSHLITNYFLYNYGKDFRANNFQQLSDAGRVIYYQNYLSVLDKIRENDFTELETHFFGNSSEHLIETLDGAAVFLAIVKGLINDNVKELYHYFIENYRVKFLNINPHFDFIKGQEDLQKLNNYFHDNPLRLAMVSSSSMNETSIVCNEAFKCFRKQISEWTVPEDKKQKILNAFSDPKNLFESIITSDDAIGLKFKPHRDNFRSALKQLNIPKDDFNKVIGFGTNESGVIAIRAAGIGMCAAIPYGKTEGYDFSAATHVLRNGLPEAILMHNLFVKPD